MTVSLPAESREARLAAALAATPDGVIESIAETAGVDYRMVLDALPLATRAGYPGTHFEALWSELSTWGPVLVIVHTSAGVFEIDTALSPGSVGRGYFNVSAGAPLHGHLSIERCAAIYLVDRPFFGRRSCSVQFIDRDGACMFKVFVKRDAARAMDAGQLARFEALAASARA